MTLKTNKGLVSGMCKKNNHKNTFFKGIGKKSTWEKTEQSTRKTSVKKKCFTVEETFMGSKRENTYEVTKEMQIKIK